MIPRSCFRIFCLVSLMGVLYCTCTPSVSGVETTNGFTVVAAAGSIEGTAPPYAQVFLFDTAYVPYLDQGTGLGTSVDSDGRFAFAVAPGVYNILVIEQDGSEAGILQKTVSSERSGNDTPVKSNLARTGTIRGAIAVTSGETILVYLAGTSYYRVLSGFSSFSFSSLPPGTGWLRFAVLTSRENVDTYSAEIVQDLPVEIRPDQVTETGTVVLD
ncbi:MAG: hypothetical protein JW863_12890 [Chitinispirillaceae bacterium]|nr:hypothetical protein [Chitinispirillaceae bacterium]